MVAQPAEERHPAHEEDGDEQERDAEPRRIRGQPRRPAPNGVGVAGGGKGSPQERPDARSGADRERAAEEDARAAAARSLQQPSCDEPVRPGQQPHEREPGDNQDEPGERLLRAVAQDAGDRVRRRAERDEHGGEAGDERQARQGDPPPDARIAQALRLHRGDGRQVAGHERQHARERNRGEPEQEETASLLHQPSKRRSSSSRRRSSAGSS